MLKTLFKIIIGLVVISAAHEAGRELGATEEKVRQDAERKKTEKK